MGFVSARSIASPSARDTNYMERVRQGGQCAIRPVQITLATAEESSLKVSLFSFFVLLGNPHDEM